MSASSGNILYAILENRGFLKLSGSIRYPLSQRLRMAVKQVFSSAKMSEVVVDLQEAQFIDSTCLGLLARVATESSVHGGGRPILVSTNWEINQVLLAMGFDKVFVLIDNPSTPTAGLINAEDLAGLAPRPDPQIVLDAHRALCEINEHNRALFQDVIEQLAAETGASGQCGSPPF